MACELSGFKEPAARAELNRQLSYGNNVSLVFHKGCGDWHVEEWAVLEPKEQEYERGI